MKMRFKLPLEDIFIRADKTRTALNQLAPDWLAPGFPTPPEFEEIIEEVRVTKEEWESATTTEGKATVLCNIATQRLHEASVAVATIGRIAFRQSEHAPVWRGLRASAQGHERILSEAAQIVSAWESSDAAWVPKAGLTLADYQALRAAAAAAETECVQCGNALNVARGILQERANGLYRLCVDWYAVGLATFAKDSQQSGIIRRILSPRRSRGKVEEPAEAVAA
jgi:hypothetical protein